MLMLTVPIAGLVLFSEAPLLAYLDPGSGSMLLQLMLGGVAALGVVFKLTWHRVVSLLPGRGERDQ